MTARPGTVECLPGTGGERDPNQKVPWTFKMVGSDLQISRTDGLDGVATGTFQRIGTTWSGSLRWSNGAVWQGIQLFPTGDCHALRTNLQQLSFQR